MRLILQSERRILGFIFALVPHLPDAEDLLQETCSVMWRKFDQFEPGTDFAAWGIAIAQYEVLEYRRKERSKKVYFSDRLMQEIAEVATQVSSQGDQRVEALQTCLLGLREKDREMIQLHAVLGRQQGAIVEMVDDPCRLADDRALSSLSRRSRRFRASWATAVCASLVLGAFLGRWLTSSAKHIAPDHQITRHATNHELQEIAALSSSSGCHWDSDAPERHEDQRADRLGAVAATVSNKTQQTPTASTLNVIVVISFQVIEPLADLHRWRRDASST